MDVTPTGTFVQNVRRSGTAVVMLEDVAKALTAVAVALTSLYVFSRHPLDKTSASAEEGEKKDDAEFGTCFLLCSLRRKQFQHQLRAERTKPPSCCTSIIQAIV